MNICCWRGALLCAVVLAGADARAEVPTGSCQLPAERSHPLLGRSESIAQFETLGERCLKALVVACSDATGGRLLGSTDAFTCSVGYEALLRGHFKGDFGAMLLWWRDRSALPALE